MQQNNVLSTNDILTWVIRIFGVIGMIFIGITLIIPWGSFNLGAGFGVSMYPWGVFSSEGETIGFILILCSLVLMEDYLQVFL